MTFVTLHGKTNTSKVRRKEAPHRRGLNTSRQNRSCAG